MRNKRRFGTLRIYISAVQFIADLYSHCDIKLTFFIECGYCTALSNIYAAESRHSFKRTLDTVINIGYYARSERCAHRCSCRLYGVAGHKSCRTLVNLNRCHFIGYADYLSYELALTDHYHLTH